MTIRYAPGQHPRPKPSPPQPRPAPDQHAVEQLLTTSCTGSRTTDRTHLIPAITTICIRCGTDAADANRLEISQ